MGCVERCVEACAGGLLGRVWGVSGRVWDVLRDVLGRVWVVCCGVC